MFLRNGRLDKVDVRVIEGLRKYGPRSLLEVSRHIHLPQSTVYDRFNELYDQRTISISPIINWSSVGLRYKVAIVEAQLNRDKEVESCLRKVPYLLSWKKADTVPPTYVAEVAEPSREEMSTSTKGSYLLKSNISRMEKTRAIERAETFNMDSFIWPCSFTDYENAYHYDSGTDMGWNLGKLGDPNYYFGKTRAADSKPHLARTTLKDFDRINLIMVSMLMRDPTVYHSDMGKLLKFTTPAAKYRYEQLRRRRIIAGYGITARKFKGEVNSCTFFLEFSSEKSRNRFMNASKDFTIVSRLGIVDDGRSLVIETMVPGANFVNPFDRMIKEGMIESQRSEPLRFSRFSKSFTRELDFKLFNGKKWVTG